MDAVSLGLQVCSGLLKYYQDCESYDVDIREMCASVDSLNMTFSLLANRFQAMGPSLPTDSTVTLATERLRSCKAGVSALEKKLTKLRNNNPSGVRPKAPAVLNFNRLIYPFRKSTLEKLKEIVQDLVRSLQFAIEVFLVDNSAEMRNDIKRVDDVVADIRGLATITKDAMLDMSAQTSATAAGVETLLTAKEAESLEGILEWLSAPDPSINHREARDKHEPGTGQWFLNCPEYSDWILGETQCLWLHGKAGCCKTVLSSTIIEDVLHRVETRPRRACAYFYFSFADPQKQSYGGLLLSMVTQLSRDSPVLPMLSAAYGKTKPYKPSDATLEEILIALLRRSDTSYLIVDALDECPENDQKNVKCRDNAIQGLRRVVDQVGSVRLLITSRKETDIEESMQEWCDTHLALNEHCVNADIDIYVKNALATDKKLLRLPAESRDEIERVFHEKSGGM